jgi:hypothetical protein
MIEYQLSTPPVRNNLNEKTGVFGQVWIRWFSDFFEQFRKTQIGIYKQNLEPIISEKANFALWQNTNDNKCYLVFKRIVGTVTDQVKVELQ